MIEKKKKSYKKHLLVASHKLLLDTVLFQKWDIVRLNAVLKRLREETCIISLTTPESEHSPSRSANDISTLFLYLKPLLSRRQTRSNCLNIHIWDLAQPEAYPLQILLPLPPTGENTTRCNTLLSAVLS